MNQNYRIFLIIYIISYSVLFILYWSDILNDSQITSAVYAGVLNIVNFVLSVSAFEYSWNKSNKIFLLFTLGGMAFRLMFVLLAIVFLFIFLNIDKYAFILAFFIIYFILLTLEVLNFKQKAELNKRKS